MELDFRAAVHDTRRPGQALQSSVCMYVRTMYVICETWDNIHHISHHLVRFYAYLVRDGPWRNNIQHLTFIRRVACIEIHRNRRHRQALD